METFLQATRDLIGLKLTPRQISLLEQYRDELAVWNERYSLTAIHEPEKVLIKHFLDSFTPLLVMNQQASGTLIDVGTGAGFPGIPLKILLPDLEVVLVDSITKKVEFCQHIIDTLNLDGIRAIRDRVERLGRREEYREGFDWAAARAVAQLGTLSEYLLPFVRLGGCMVAMKGDQGLFEAHQAQPAFRLLGGELRGIRHLTLPGVPDERYLVVVEKKAPTPEKYPRRVGVPVKKPL